VLTLTVAQREGLGNHDRVTIAVRVVVQSGGGGRTVCSFHMEVAWLGIRERSDCLIRAAPDDRSSWRAEVFVL